MEFSGSPKQTSETLPSGSPKETPETLLAILIGVVCVIAFFLYMNWRDAAQAERKDYSTCLRTLTEEQMASFETANKICG